MINMKLRDQYDSLEELCDSEDVDPASLMVKLNAAGYEYDEVHNAFRPVDIVTPDTDAPGTSTSSAS